MVYIPGVQWCRGRRRGFGGSGHWRRFLCRSLVKGPQQVGSAKDSDDSLLVKDRDNSLIPFHHLLLNVLERGVGISQENIL